MPCTPSSSIPVNDYGNYDETKMLFEEALAIRECVLGPQHPATATSLYNLAELLHTQGKSIEAYTFYRRALSIFERVLGPYHTDTAKCRRTLVRLYGEADNYTEDYHSSM